MHNCRRVASNEAIGRHIFQNHRPSGNNRTLANRYSRENQAADCNPASRANEDGRNLELEISRRTSWLPVQRNERRATKTFDSIVTCARLRIPTSSPIQTWSPMTRRHGKERFTLLPIPTPFPIFAPKRTE